MQKKKKKEEEENIKPTKDFTAQSKEDNLTLKMQRNILHLTKLL